jgi:hypothetical protein
MVKTSDILWESAEARYWLEQKLPIVLLRGRAPHMCSPRE